MPHMLTLSFPSPGSEPPTYRTLEPTTLEVLLIVGLLAIGVLACATIAQNTAR